MLYLVNYTYKIIKKSNDNFVVVCVELDTHAHLGSFWGCKKLIQLIKSGEEIKNPYFQKACLRLTGELKENKQKYYNRSKAQRKACGAKFASMCY